MFKEAWEHNVQITKPDERERRKRRFRQERRDTTPKGAVRLFPKTKSRNRFSAWQGGASLANSAVRDIDATAHNKGLMNALQTCLVPRAEQLLCGCPGSVVSSNSQRSSIWRIRHTFRGVIIPLLWMISGTGLLDLNGSEVGTNLKSKPVSNISSSPSWKRNGAKTRPPHPVARPTPRPWVVEGESADSRFARLVGPAGDVNGDGFADVWIAEHGFKNGIGRVLVYYGSPSGLISRPDWSAEGAAGTGPFGIWAEGVGDVDRDGFDDFAVLAQDGYYELANRPPGHNDTVYFYRGSPSGLRPEASWKISAKQLSVIAILMAGRAGDVNGDGFADIYLLTIVSQPAGRAYRVMIFHSSPTGPQAVPATYWDLEGPLADLYPRLACAGDVNGDGYDDFLIGQPKWNGRTKARGRVLVYHGSPQGLNSTPAWSATYDLPAQKDVDEDYEQHFGWSVAAAGDVNGDGFADIIVGAPYADHGDVNEGLAFVYHGSPKGLSHKPQWIIEGNHAHALLGFSVSGVGDVNGDGFDDVIVGVPYATDGQYNEGAALLFHGTKKGLHHSPDWSFESDNSQQFLGTMVAAAGDVNGDGYADVLVASPDFIHEGKKVGRVNLFYGTPKGLPNSFNWSIDKPFLIAIDQWMDRVSESRKLAVAGALWLLCALLFIIWRRTAARMRRAENELVRNRERERLARDVHDHLGADLSHIALWSELTKESPTGSETTRDNLEQIASTARSALASISELVWRLDPSNDKLENFAARLEYLAQQALLLSGVQLSLDFPDDLPEATVGSAARTDVAFMLKEALRNVVQHAAATQVTVQLRVAPPNSLSLRVTDNGKGFVLPPPNHAKSAHSNLSGNGLRNLEARTANLGGQIQIETAPGQGTSLSITVPLNYSRLSKIRHH